MRVYTGEVLQVMSNLVGSTLDALPETGSLYLRGRESENEDHLTVADNGEGIPDEICRARIFDPENGYGSLEI